MNAYGPPIPAPYPAPTPPPAAFPQQIHILGIVGGTLATVGSLLAWTRVEGHSLMAGDADGVRGTSGDGLWTLILGLVAVALFLAARFARKPVLNAVGVVPGLIAAGIAALNIANPDRLARARLEEEMSLTDAQWNQVASSFEFSATIGVFVVLLGALATVVGGILAVTQLRKG